MSPCTRHGNKNSLLTHSPSQLFGSVFRGKGIPYVESLDEQRLRKLWENDPFSTANSVVDTILMTPRGDANDENATTPILQRLLTPREKQYKLSGYEDLFEPLYGSESLQEKPFVSTGE